MAELDGDLFLNGKRTEVSKDDIWFLREDGVELRIFGNANFLYVVTAVIPVDAVEPALMPLAVCMKRLIIIWISKAGLCQKRVIPHSHSSAEFHSVKLNAVSIEQMNVGIFCTFSFNGCHFFFRSSESCLVPGNCQIMITKAEDNVPVPRSNDGQERTQVSEGICKVSC